MATRTRGPLEPFASVVSGLAGVSLILLVAGVVMLVAGFGTLAAARILAIATAMHEELAATV